MKKWIIDLAHSEVTFKVRHLMIANVTGHFRKFYVEAFIDDNDFSKIRDIQFTADIASIDTGNKDRDEHLKGPEFFNVAQNSQITFISTQYEMKDNSGVLSGVITIHSITNPIKAEVEFGGSTIDSYGQTKAGFTVSGKLNRKDFGLTWGSITETGGVVVGDEVAFHCEIQLVKES